MVDLETVLHHSGGLLTHSQALHCGFSAEQVHARVRRGDWVPLHREVYLARQVPLTTLVPAFVISELRRAFEIGFLLFVPFLIIDLVVASILMSVGMMMLPPATVALPFKLIFFVLVDGWSLVAGSLVQSYGT